jgi:hypothetical protein
VSSKMHLAGVIPVANLKTDFDLKTPDVLIPIEAGFTAIQHAVHECAMAACNTIWIVANDDLAPIIKKVIGEWVYDPVYYKRPSKFSSEQRKEIPIYYVQVHPKDRDKRDSYGWSVLYGIYSAWKVSHKISRWVCPEKYYISFPMGILDVSSLRTQRRAIGDRSHNFFLTWEGQTVKDNLPLSFTMFGEDFKRNRQAVNKKTTRKYLPPAEGEKYPTQTLPLEERWSAQHFNFKDIFGETDEENSVQVELDWFHDISTWCGYRNYLASSNIIKVPEEGLTKPHVYVKLPYTEGEQ